MIGSALAILGVVIYFATRGSTPAPKPVQQVAPTPQPPTIAQPSQSTVPFGDDQPRPQQQPTGPDPSAVAAQLEKDLKRQRLWSTVTVTGNRVEVRSGSCADPAMGPLLDGAAGELKAAGVAHLRCVEQSGHVVSDRDL